MHKRNGELAAIARESSPRVEPFLPIYESQPSGKLRHGLVGAIFVFSPD